MVHDNEKFSTREGPSLSIGLRDNLNEPPSNSTPTKKEGKFQKCKFFAKRLASAIRKSKKDK